LAVERVGWGDSIGGRRRNKAVAGLKEEVEEENTNISKMEEVTSVWDGVDLVTGQCPKATRKDGRHKWEKWPKDADQAGRTCVDCGAPRLGPKPFNPNSVAQVRHLLYDLLKVPEQTNKKGEVSTDKECIQKVKKKRPKLAGLCDAILHVKDLRKQIGTLNSKLSKDGRFMYTMSIGTAWTSRWSSSKDPFGQGSNIQNIAERHRHIFEADYGKELFYADLKTAESMVVAYLADDKEYINAHLSGDVHTYVARLVWPELPWTGDLKKDKEVGGILPEWDPAPGHGYRFQAKRLQHGSNYGLTAYGIARLAHIPQAAAEAAQDAYFSAFPGIRNTYHAHVRDRVERQVALVTPFGHRITMFGRPWDAQTWRQGLSLLPQQTVVMVLNIGLLRLWREHDPELVELLAQVHDAGLGQFRKQDRERAADAIVEHLTVPVPMGEHTMTIPVEVTAGRNWGYASDANPEGQRTLR